MTVSHQSRTPAVRRLAPLLAFVCGIALAALPWGAPAPSSVTAVPA